MSRSLSHDADVGPPTIRAVDPEAMDEALRLVFSGYSAEDSADHVGVMSGGIRSGEISPAGLLGAHRGRRLVGAVLAQVQQGKTAVLWPPRTVRGELPATARLLLDASCQWLALQDVQLAHALLASVNPAEESLLCSAGFDRLATLLYLVSSEADFPTSTPDGPLAFEPYHRDNHPRLARLVDATYDQTMDCPALNGLRTMDDVLAGYRATGVFAAERWFLVRHEEHDAGCLLLTDHPQDENWELVYMGLVVPARGRGRGKQIVRHAQWLTRQAGRSRLVLAVDAANRPALEMYTATGFRAWDRREVYIRALGGAPNVATAGPQGPSRGG